MLQQSAGLYPCLRLTASLVLQVSVLNLSSTTFGNPVNIIMSMPSFVKDILSETSSLHLDVVSFFSNWPFNIKTHRFFASTFLSLFTH